MLKLMPQIRHTKSMLKSAGRADGRIAAEPGEEVEGSPMPTN
jgi:hypothetical protein